MTPRQKKTAAFSVNSVLGTAVATESLHKIGVHMRAVRATALLVVTRTGSVDLCAEDVSRAVAEGLGDAVGRLPPVGPLPAGGGPKGDRGLSCGFGLSDAAVTGTKRSGPGHACVARPPRRSLRSTA